MSSLNFETTRNYIETFLNSNYNSEDDYKSSSDLRKFKNDLTKFKNDLTKFIDDIIIKVNTDITNLQNIIEKEGLAKIQEENKEKERQLEELKDQIIEKYHGNTGLIYKKEVDRAVDSWNGLVITFCFIYYENENLYYGIGFRDKEGAYIYSDKGKLIGDLIDMKKELTVNKDYNYVLETLKELNKGPPPPPPPIPLTPTGGKNHHASTYKSNGEKVYLLINKKKLHRSIYVKGNGKAKYCKINNEFVLLSKLKNKVIV